MRIERAAELERQRDRYRPDQTEEFLGAKHDRLIRASAK